MIWTCSVLQLVPNIYRVCRVKNFLKSIICKTQQDCTCCHDFQIFPLLIHHFLDLESPRRQGCQCPFVCQQSFYSLLPQGEITATIKRFNQMLEGLLMSFSTFFFHSIFFSPITYKPSFLVQPCFNTTIGF